MIKFLALLFVLLNLFESLSQTNEVRMTEIGKMYMDINQLISDSSAICREAVKMVLDGYSPDSGQLYFEQKAEFCMVNSEYATYSGFFTGYELDLKSTFYYKNGLPFFVIINGQAEGNSYYREAYFDEYGNFMMLINSENNLAGSNTLELEIITDGELLMQTEEEINEVLKEIKSILGE